MTTDPSPNDHKKDVRPFAALGLRVHDGKPREKLRFVLDHASSLYPLFSLDVGPDGSLYLSRRAVAPLRTKQGSKRIRDGLVRVRYDEGEPVPEGRHRHLSIHSSGTFMVGTQIGHRDPLWITERQEEVARILFEYPPAYPRISRLRRGDWQVAHAIASDRPLQASIHVAPERRMTPAFRSEAVLQTSFFFRFAGLDNPDPLIVQVVLWHGPVGPWPPATYFTYVGRRPTNARPPP